MQGSRFIPGGISENLPFSRWVGVKFIHSPLITLASRFRYTDTTNGFRAYSAKFLADPRVAAFRDIFVGYELHYYLAIRAARLGFRVTEIPVARRYPRTARCQRRSARFAATCAYCDACLRRASVDTTRSNMNNVAAQDDRSHAWIGVLATVLAFVIVAKITFFSPDSWSYLELSNTVYSDFYRANTVRQYVVDSE